MLIRQYSPFQAFYGRIHPNYLLEPKAKSSKSWSRQILDLAYDMNEDGKRRRMTKDLRPTKGGEIKV
jgi:hypothetical protein